MMGRTFISSILSFAMLWLSLPLVAQPGKNSAFGGIFTPRGDFKVLIVFAGFIDKPSTNPNFTNAEAWVDRWPVDSQGRGLPDYVDANTGHMPMLVYQQATDFDTYRELPENQSLSKFFETMSLGTFRLIGDVFRDSSGLPVRVDINPMQGQGWSDMNRKVVERMREINPGFDFAAFDQRKNNPNYSFDNSLPPHNVPDGKVDYMIVVYRYNNTWAQQPVPNMTRWVGSGGGFASLTGVQACKPINGVGFNEGFTMPLGTGLPTGLYVHEIAHMLYNCPHFAGGNCVCGDFFRIPSTGWSATGGNMFYTLNAWERWYLGYIEPLTIKVDSANLSQTHEVELTDYIATGQAIRIEIPHSGGQSLWLEYHAGIHPFDKHPWYGQTPGGLNAQPLSDIEAGVYVYQEDAAKARTQIVQALGPAANAIRILPADGLHEYSHGDSIYRNNWGNAHYLFTRGKESPINGTHPLWYYRDDHDKNGKIQLNTNYNAANDNDGCGYAISMELVGKDTLTLYRSFGVYTASQKHYASGPAFGHGEQMGIHTNPVPTSLARYDMRNARWNPMVLNGLSMSFNYDQPGKVKVRVAFDQIRLSRSARWTGHIHLPDIIPGQFADLIIATKQRLQLDQASSPNRHMPDSTGLFIDPTVFKLLPNSTLELEAKAQLVLEPGVECIVSPGAVLVLGKKSRIIVKPGAKLIVDESQILRARGSKILYRKAQKKGDAG
jgi:hypothetical protein